MSCKTSSSAITLKRVERAKEPPAKIEDSPRSQTVTASAYIPFTPPTTPKSRTTSAKPSPKLPRAAKDEVIQHKEKLENVLKKQLIFTAFAPSEIKRDRLGKPLVDDPSSRSREVFVKPRKNILEDPNVANASITLAKSVPNSPRIMSRRRDSSLNRASLNKDRPAHYGTPVEGSKTEQRAILAHKRICQEVLKLCEIVDEHGTEDPNDFKVKISFKRLFEIYTYISDKVVGVLLRARKHKLLDFEGETLFQGQDNHKIITLLMPIHAIQKKLAAEEEKEFSWGKCM